MYLLVAQIIGILAMIMNVFSLQLKTQKNIIRMQLLGSVLFVVNMFMLNAVMGCILNAIGILRAVVYSNKTFFKAEKKAWIYLFLILYVCAYVVSFTVFKKAPTAKNLIIEFLPLVAMFVTTLSFSKKKSSDVRKFVFISDPLWLTYNCVNFSIGGALCEIFNLVSTIAAIIRLDLKPEKK